jgi:hypothetical protein
VLLARLPAPLSRAGFALQFVNRTDCLPGSIADGLTRYLRITDGKDPSMGGLMLISALSIVVGILLVIGGVQEFYFRGLLNHETQPFFIGLLGAITGLLLVLSGKALMRKWSEWRTLALSGAVLNLVFLVYAAAAPHRNVGIFALLIGVLASAALVLQVARTRSRGTPHHEPPSSAPTRA